MKPQVRVALVILILALAAGWLGLRRVSASLEQAIAARAPAKALASPETTR
jgi:hypothetical protein